MVSTSFSLRHPFNLRGSEERGVGGTRDRKNAGKTEERGKDRRTGERRSRRGGAGEEEQSRSRSRAGAGAEQGIYRPYTPGVCTAGYTPPPYFTLGTPPHLIPLPQCPHQPRSVRHGVSNRPLGSDSLTCSGCRDFGASASSFLLQFRQSDPA